MLPPPFRESAYDEARIMLEETLTLNARGTKRQRERCRRRLLSLSLFRKSSQLWWKDRAIR